MCEDDLQAGSPEFRASWNKVIQNAGHCWGGAWSEMLSNWGVDLVL